MARTPIPADFRRCRDKSAHASRRRSVNIAARELSGGEDAGVDGMKYRDGKISSTSSLRRSRDLAALIGRPTVAECAESRPGGDERAPGSAHGGSGRRWVSRWKHRARSIPQPHAKLPLPSRRQPCARMLTCESWAVLGGREPYLARHALSFCTSYIDDTHSTHRDVYSDTARVCSRRERPGSSVGRR